MVCFFIVIIKLFFQFLFNGKATPRPAGTPLPEGNNSPLRKRRCTSKMCRTFPSFQRGVDAEGRRGVHSLSHFHFYKPNSIFFIIKSLMVFKVILRINHKLFTMKKTVLIIVLCVFLIPVSLTSCKDNKRTNRDNTEDTRDRNRNDRKDNMRDRSD